MVRRPVETDLSMVSSVASIQCTRYERTLDGLESHTLKVVVEREGAADSGPAHEGEAAAVDQAQLAAAFREEEIERCIVHGLFDKVHLDDGEKIVKAADGFNPGAALKQADRFHDNIIGRVQRFARAVKVRPFRKSAFVGCITRQQQCVKRARVDEDQRRFTFFAATASANHAS